MPAPTDEASSSLHGDSIYRSPDPNADSFKTALDDALAQGFRMLRFGPRLEAAYRQHKASEPLRLWGNGWLLVLALFNAMLVTDWIMVPDQWTLALCLRLGFFTPLAIACLASAKRLGPLWRERCLVGLRILSVLLTVTLCLRSTDPLAAPYLITLALILMFNGGVMRSRFWQTLWVDLAILAIYGLALASVRNPPMAVMIPCTLVLLSTTVFTLYSTYWLEHEERANWLLQEQERHLVEALGRANRRLDHMSRFDALTDLANRRHFDEFLQQLWARARRGGQAIALLMMDVDHFKAYNDHYGHPKGDACLRKVAETLKRQLRRPGDLVARFGGEEFIAVLHNATPPLALAAAERVRASVEQLRLPHAAAPGTGQQVTISIGVACLGPRGQDGALADLLAASDAALYQAKARGRNRVAFSAQPQA